MGCCFSSEEDKDSGYQDPTERTRLLDPNARNASPPSQGTRLKVVMANSGRQGSFRMVLPAGVTNPLAVLGAPPLSPAEIQLICSTAEKVTKATREVRVQHREDLVVSFGVPVP